VARHCPECGFVNAEGANYCSRCGSFIGQPETTSRDPQSTTATYVIDDATGELRPVDAAEMASGGGALIIRSGGGRVGQSFALRGDRLTIGRSPEADVFLDDVTVSRNHALIVRRRDGLYIDDLGSLNGTYVNRRRIESHKLVDGDELQVGKYKLTYLAG
jgi:pSer/pThr/pTyr-binding forkhead associated (FHA) protein